MHSLETSNLAAGLDQVFLGAVAATLVVVILLVLWSWQVRRLVRSRTAELREEVARRRRGEQRFRRMFELTPVPLWILDSEGTVRWVNDAFVRVFGYQRDDIPTLERWWELTFPEPAARRGAMENWKRVVDAAGRFDAAREPVELRGLRCHCGMPRTVEVSGADLGDELLVAFVDLSEREESARALREAGAELSEAQRVARMGSWKLDLRTGDVTWTREIYRVMGLDPDGPAPNFQDHPRLFTPESWKRLESAVARARDEGIPYELELQNVRPDGSRSWLLAIGEPLRDAEGRVSALRGVSIDITERKNVEESLRREERFNTALLENLDAGVIACDAEGRLSLFNRVAREWHGAGPSPVGSGEWADRYGLLHPDGTTTLPESEIPLARAWRGETVRGSRICIAAPGQPPRHIVTNASMVRGADGEKLGAVVVMHDITAQREAEARLQLQIAALNAAANAIVITDQEGHIVWTNHAFRDLTGYEPEEAVGQSPRILRSGAQDRKFYEQMWDTIRGGQFWRGELRNRRKDGSLYDEEMTITPLRSAGGEITHFIAIKQDVTDRRSLEQQYLRAQRLEGIGMLAGGIAHDLNNVLVPVLMGVDLLKMEDIPGSARELVDSIEASARRGADIVKQVLTFARGVDGERTEVSLRFLVKEMARMARETFPRSIRIETDMPADLWSVRGDPTQLHQVLLNLSVNARDAMPTGGELVFAASNRSFDEEAARAVPGLSPGDYVRLEVRDDGEGMTPEVLDRLFEPFFTTKPKGQGTGLGLSTVLGIVRGHRGAITVESDPGAGTRFAIHLPAIASAPIGKQEESSSVPPSGRGQLLLLVDDEPAILSMLEAILERSGYRTRKAGNGAEGLVDFLEHEAEIALVLTDVMMPVMDGVALVSAIRQRRPDLPCIASSGLMSLEDQVRMTDLRDLGVRSFLTKPFATETLLRMVHEELQRAPATGPAS